jgi:drug/metabolite transporter (DMT)-like permease
MKYWLRWLAVIPGAVVGGVLLTFPLHWILYNTLSNIIDPYPELPEQILTPLVIAAGVVWVGARIAPARKIATAVVLLGLWMVFLGGMAAVMVSRGNIGGREVSLGVGLGPVMAVVGGVVGLLVVRNEVKGRVGRVKPRPSP